MISLGSGKKVVAPVLGRYFPDFEYASGRGCYLTGTDGEKYLDFCVRDGRFAPRTLPSPGRGRRRQAGETIHICIGIANYEPYMALAEQLSAIMPFKDAQLFFCQSGTEAVEAALKLAKYVTRKPGIIALRGAFHGHHPGLAFRHHIQNEVSGRLSAAAARSLCRRARSAGDRKPFERKEDRRCDRLRRNLQHPNGNSRKRQNPHPL